MNVFRLNLAALVLCLLIIGCNEPTSGGFASSPKNSPSPQDQDSNKDKVQTPPPTNESPSPSPEQSPSIPPPDPSPSPSPDPSPSPSPDPSPSPSASPSATPYSFTPTQSLLFAGIPIESGYEDGAQLPNVRFSAPASVAVTPDGKIFITDRNLHTVRQYDASTLAVSTVYGIVGRSGTKDGIGSVIRFNGPTGATFLAGFLYICDTGNHRIRRIDLSTGESTTLTGSTSGYKDGAFASAQFNSPRGIATDGTYLYVSDYANHTIRRLDLTSSTVSTIAGEAGKPGDINASGTSARFRNPIGIAANSTHLYVADYGNNRIRKIVLSSAAVTTLAGSGAGYVNAIGTSAKFRNPYDLCLSGSSLYVSDYLNSVLRKVETSNGATTLAAGLAQTVGAVDGVTPTSRLGNPAAVSCVTGAVILSDLYLKNIREFNISTNTLTTKLGPLVAPIACKLQNGTLYTNRIITPSKGAKIGDIYYFADATHHVIRQLNTVTGQLSLLAGLVGTAGTANGTLTGARFNTPLGVETDGTHLYVADSKNHTIRKIDLDTSTVSLYAGVSGAFGTTDGSALSAKFREPSNLLYSENTLIISDTQNHAIRSLDMTSTQVSTLAGIKGSSGKANGALGIATFNHPKGLALKNATLYVADSSNHTIREVDLVTGVTSVLSGGPGAPGSVDGAFATARFNQPVGLAVIENDVFVADQRNNSIRKISLTFGTVTTLNTATPGASFGPSRETSGILDNVKYFLPQAITYNPSNGLIVINRCSMQILTE